jgi:16S rRNA (cytosine1402-N4)-methyltransferase
MTVPHIPVLHDAVLAALIPSDAPPARVIDGTLGAGGHTHALLSRGVGAVLGLDQDPSALEIARECLVDFPDRMTFYRGNYVHMQDAAAGIGWDAVDGILLDIGVSSMQLDRPERGFSFMHDGPLDMRMDTSSGLTAADIVNEWTAAQLAEIFYEYGEERHGRALAAAIVAGRPYHTTGELAATIAERKPAQWKEKIHPATRVFQALRIVVNDELGVLERVIPTAIDLLRPGGRLAIITFHSLEDRVVKRAFKLAATDCVCPPKQPVCTCDHRARVQTVTRKPITADADEIANNPRSRSAKLRVVERL